MPTSFDGWVHPEEVRQRIEGLERVRRAAVHACTCPPADRVAALGALEQALGLLPAPVLADRAAAALALVQELHIRLGVPDSGFTIAAAQERMRDVLGLPPAK